MKIVFDLQGNHGLVLNVQGVVYELDVIDEDGVNQHFALEGSIGALNNFFTLGKKLVDGALANEGDPSDLEPEYFGPDAEEIRNL